MSRSIRCIPEVVEPLGFNSVESRTEALRFFDGLGPPDLCRLSKMETRLTGTDRRTVCQSVIGIDTLDSSSIVSYINGLMESAEAFNPLAGGRWKIDAGTYCTWDCFSGTDIRVVVQIPGMPGVSFHSVDREGISSDVIPQEVWEGAMLSSFLRASQSVDTRCLNVLPNLASAENLTTVIRLLGKFMERSDVTGVPEASRFGTNIFTMTLCEIFLKRMRLRQGIELFSSLQSVYPPIVIHIAMAYGRRGQNDAVLSILTRALRACPENEHMLILVAETFLREGVVDLAYAAAELATAVSPGNPWGWIVLGEVCRRMRHPDRTILALNNALCDYQSASDRYALSDGLPHLTQTCEITLPHDSHGIASNLSLWNRPKRVGELDLSSSVEPLILGHGRGLATWLDDDPTRNRTRVSSTTDAGIDKNVLVDIALNKTESATYKVLVRLREDVGWDWLVAARARAFSQGERPMTIDLVDQSPDRSPASELSDATVGDQAIRTCSSGLDRLFTMVHGDLNSMLRMRTELTERAGNSWLPKHTPHIWAARVRVCHRFRKDDYLEIACRMTLLQSFSPYVAKRLLKLYTRLGKATEAIAVLVNIWFNVGRQVFYPAPSAVPWLNPSVKQPGYAPFLHCPPWLVDLVINTCRRFGIQRIRKGISMTDKRLVLLDQLLAYIQADPSIELESV